MASRSRKRRPAPDPQAGSVKPGDRSRPTSGPATSRAADPAAGPATSCAADPAAPPAATAEPPLLTPEELALLELDPMARRYARGRARDEAVRQGLEPLAPGERPRVVTVAAVVAFVFAIANVVATLTVDDLGATQGNPTMVAVVTTGILLLAAGGMLAGKYWAVLGFQCILGLQIIVLSLAFTRVQKWWIAICLVVFVGLLGYLFWKLIRAMARLQMPRPGRVEPNPDESTR
jgi:hypothetical protein